MLQAKYPSKGRLDFKTEELRPRAFQNDWNVRQKSRYNRVKRAGCRAMSIPLSRLAGLDSALYLTC